MSFWETATTEQRLEQIDAAISLGLTSKQVAMNLGANSEGSVRVFASRAGRHFNGTSDGQRLAWQVGAHALEKKHADRFGWNTNSDAVSIFPRQIEESLFEANEYEEAI